MFKVFPFWFQPKTFNVLIGALGMLFLCLFRRQLIYYSIHFWLGNMDLIESESGANNAEH
jgi:hypothetical protein